EKAHRRGVLAGRVVAAVGEGGEPRRHRREGVGFGGEGCGEDAHGMGSRKSESVQAAGPERRRAGDSIAAVTPKRAIDAGTPSPAASAAHASPIAADVWMP